MRPQREFKLVEWILWALIAVGLLVLFGCHSHLPADRKPILIEGGIHCAPQNGQIFCAVHLEEVIMDLDDE